MRTPSEARGFLVEVEIKNVVPRVTWRRALELLDSNAGVSGLRLLLA